jgi:hypothetical protein
MPQQDLANLLQQTVATELPHLRTVTENQASRQLSKPGAWSKKEELGHLIGSAINNHARFVRMTLEDDYQGPSYAQDRWVALHAYRDLPWSALIDVWEKNNFLLMHLIAQIPGSRLSSQGVVGSNPPVTLRFLIEDYVLHMQHHLDHVLSREKITPYPRPQTL